MGLALVSEWNVREYYVWPLGVSMARGVEQTKAPAVDTGEAGCEIIRAFFSNE